MNKQDIIKEAVHSYERNFIDGYEVVNQDMKGSDVALDKEELLKGMELKKETVEKKHESLEVLRDQLIVEAEDSLEKTFGKEEKVAPAKKLNTQEMYEELEKEKQHTSQMVTHLKQEQLAKMKH